MAGKKKAPAKKTAAKKDADAAMLAKHEHHQRMASQHRAHADLIEAKLKTQGKRIGYDYGNKGGVSPSAPPKRKIVPNDDRY